MDDTQSADRGARRWKQDGWIARVTRNEDGDGWAVEMTRVGDSEPVLVGPWTMGRDKVNPKPLDHPAFMALVKGASDVMRRHEQAARARLHRELVAIDSTGQRLRIELDLAEDEDDPHAMVSVFVEGTKECIRTQRVEASWQLNAASAKRFLNES